VTPQQIAVLNSLVTFAAENMPGGLSAEERAVARIVGGWTVNDRTVEPRSRIGYAGDDE
jgi:hypothetical protein